MIVCAAARLSAATQATNAGFRFAAIADTHFRTPEALGEFRQFLHALREQGSVDFLLILGDICAHAPEYLPLARNVADTSGLQVYGVAGNHDDDYGRRPEWYESSWGQSRYTFDHKDWRFVVYSDMARPDAWLRAALAQAPADRPTVFCRHYPPNDYQADAANEPWKTVLAKGNVRLALCGHTHSERQWRLAELPGLTLGASFFQPPRPTYWYLFEATAKDVRLLRKAPVDELPRQEIADALPTISFDDDGAEGAPLSGRVRVAGKAADDKTVDRVEYSIDFGDWRPAQGGASWHFDLHTRSLPDGHHVLTARVTD
jgi:predicted phosphodiesterase